MKRLSIALAAAAAAAFVLMGTSPSHAHAGKHNYNTGPSGYHPAQPGRKRHRGDRGHYNALREKQIRQECRTYAFRYWRYHPNYLHCRHY